MKIILVLSWVTSLALLAFSPAHAYVGPGPGLSMIGSLLTLVGGIILALAMVLIWPIRMMLKRRKNQSQDNPKSND